MNAAAIESGKFVSVGAGLIGRSWAIRFAAAGWQVTLFDHDERALEASLPLAARSIEAMARVGLVTRPDEVQARLGVDRDLSSALAGARWVQESVIEDLAIKRALWSRIDEACATSAVLASSTSALPGSTFMRQLKNRARALVVHPALPPHVIPVVEVVPTPWTDTAVVHSAAAILRDVGNHPLVLKREVAGFIWNRLQIALVKEGMNLVADGYCEPADVDDVFVHGLGLRLAFTGVFESMHLAVQGGLRETPKKYADFPTRLPYDPYKSWPEPDKLTDTMAALLRYAEARVPVAELDERRRWREESIMQLLKLKAG